VSASGKKIDVVTQALNALAALNSAAQAAAIASSATAPASPATALASTATPASSLPSPPPLPQHSAPPPSVPVAPSGSSVAAFVFGGYHEEADSIIAQANDHYQQKLEDAEETGSVYCLYWYKSTNTDTEDADGAPDGLGRGRAAGQYLTCYQLGGVQSGRYCCNAQCGTCSGGGRGSADPCMQRGPDWFRSYAWGQANCCSPADGVSYGITASCETHDPPCICASKEECRALAAASSSAPIAPASPSAIVSQSSSQSASSGVDLGGNLAAAGSPAATALKWRSPSEDNIWGGLGEGMDADSPKAAYILAQNFNSSIFGHGPLGLPAVATGGDVGSGGGASSGDGTGTSGSSSSSNSGDGGGGGGVSGSKGGGNEAAGGGAGDVVLVKRGAARFSAETFGVMDTHGTGKIAAAE